MPEHRAAPIPAVGVVCLRGAEVLLIRRANPPRQGEWSLPGGRIEWGETAASAALRELAEETGVTARLLGLVDVVDGVFRTRGTGEPWAHYLLVDFAARWMQGEPAAGDDASEALFAPVTDLARFRLWGETERIIHAAIERFPE